MRFPSSHKILDLRYSFEIELLFIDKNYKNLSLFILFEVFDTIINLNIESILNKYD